jgi:hypothetical protein
MNRDWMNSSRDWPEDFPGENGNYTNRCIFCKQTFVGHKRRMVCKECFEESKRKFEALSPEEQQTLLDKQRAEVAVYMENRSTTQPTDPTL